MHHRSVLGDHAGTQYKCTSTRGNVGRRRYNIVRNHRHKYGSSDGNPGLAASTKKRRQLKEAASIKKLVHMQYLTELHQSS
jgi:hypothetical protein